MQSLNDEVLNVEIKLLSFYEWIMQLIFWSNLDNTWNLVKCISENFPNRPCSSEEQELERIRNLQKEVALHRKKNEASYKAALAGSE